MLMKKLFIVVSLSLLATLGYGDINNNSNAVAADQPVSQEDATVLAKADNSNCSDALLKTQLQTIYATNSVLRGYNIKIDLQDSVATLSGNVRDDSQKDLAIEIAKDLNGVKKVMADDLKVDPNTQAGEASQGDYFQKVADATITSAVKTRLLTARKVHGTAIQVTTTNNIVTLEGTVASAEERVKAGKVAISTLGVSSVRNNLKIAG